LRIQSLQGKRVLNVQKKNQRKLELYPPGTQILQAQPTAQGDTTFTMQQQPHFQQMTLAASPVHARRPPKQPRLVQTQSPLQGQMSQSLSAHNQNHGFVQHQLPRQILIQGHVPPSQQSQIIPNLSNSLPVPQHVLNASGVSSFQDWTSSMTSSPVRFVFKTRFLLSYQA
jgi:hypothetical protein